VSPCAHVAAATIAWVQGTASREAGGPVSAVGPKGPSAELRYLLSIEHGALGIARAFVVDGTPRPLEISLTDRIARGIVEPRYEPTHDDMTIDRLFMRRLKGDVPLELMGSVLDALSRARDVRLGNEVVRTSGDPVMPDARVEDAPRGGVKLVVVPPADCAVMAMCVAKVGGVLRPLAETARFGLRFEKLPIERVFGPPELGTLVAEILPELERSMVVAIATKRLPRRARRLPPRIEFELSHEHGALFVLPLLVYGDPACARIDAGKLVLLSPPAPVREEAKERELLSHLRDELALVPGRRVRFDGREAAKFAQRLEQFHLRDESARSLGEPAAVRELVPRIVADGQKLDIVFELPPGDDDERDTPRVARASDVASAWNEGLGIVALEGGGFARLPEKFFAEHGQAILDLVASKGDDEEMPKTAWPVVLEVADSLGVSLPAIRDAIAPIARDFEGIPDVVLPATVADLLRPYQRDGAKWLAFLRDASLGGLLSDDMGLGKTVQLLSILRGPALVVCPKSVVYNWASEIARFRPDLKVARYEGPGRAIDPTADITLTTYAVLRIDIEDLSKIEWAMAVLDEAQAIKNPDSQAARAAFRLQAKARFCLTGTPVENRLDDLWSLLRFSNPGLLGTRADFLERYAGPMMDGNAGVAERLRKRIKPFVLRRTKKEVLTDLPPRTEAVQYCELSEEERASYQAVLAATRKEVVEKLAEGANVLLMLEALLRLRQAACHAGLLPGNQSTSSSKVERLVDSLEELVAEGHKALVFSQWTSLLDRVEPHLAEANLGFVRLDGATRDREAVVRAFQAPEGPPVMLLSLKAGGVGLNLTRADHVFLLDPWWNPAVEDQAADRAHRIGQDRPVMVYRLVAKDTVEERILVLQEKKRKLADAAIGEGASRAAAIT
ncbi:MAG: DEAD/DEAH box helicase, partial [Myxococcales bacterium]|nr:DEAD/DEAH box helicase [Myxococcales bacterium]